MLLSIPWFYIKKGAKMAIFKSSNHSPNLQEVDLDSLNTFSCVVNTTGEPAQAYLLTVLSENGEEMIAQGSINTSTQQYIDGASNLKVPVPNRGTLRIPNITSNFHRTGKTFENGKNYQWSIRTYNAVLGSQNQPNTKVCEGFLVGSTKYVVWSRIPKTQTEPLDQILYDRYIEFAITDEANIIIGAHEPPEKEKPKPNGQPISASNPYIQRKKIDWVTKELGIDSDFVKIETNEAFDYDYPDGTPYTIYQCSSNHTVQSLFADPNSEINISEMVIVYKDLAKARAAADAGETPSNIKDRSRWADCMLRTNGEEASPRKVVGYSSDTGEMRFYDSFKVPPKNGEYYRIFKYDIVNSIYLPVDDSDEALANHKVGGTPITNSTYYKTISNKWGNSASDHRLFIQPNINIKSDATNPNEIVFENGVRIDIKKQSYYVDDREIDVTFNKLDNTQWLIESCSKATTPIGPEAIPAGSAPPIIPQSDYVVYTDFSDSAPNSLIYCRKAPNIILQYRNAIRDIIEGYLDGNTFYDVNGQVVTPDIFHLYYDSTNGVSAETGQPLGNRYYYWQNEIFINIPTELKEGTYQNGDFYNSVGEVIPRNINYLYRDITTDNYYRYICTTVQTQGYELTNEREVVWVNIDSRIRDFREVKFRALLVDDNGIEVVDPQVKNYTYYLYAYPKNSIDNVELISTSDTIYSTDLSWVFKGLDGTADEFYTPTNPHRYQVVLKIVDEYDKQYTISSNFGIFYETEAAPVSIDVDLLCDEQAYKVVVSPPAYAESTSYIESGAVHPTVTNNNIGIGEGCVTIPDDYTLNYTRVSGSDVPLTFPKVFSMLVKQELTREFIEKYNGTLPTLVEINHSLETNEYTVVSGATFYEKQAIPSEQNIIFYYNSPELVTPIGTLTQNTPYEIYSSTAGKFYINNNPRYIRLSDVNHYNSTSAIVNNEVGVTISPQNEVSYSVALETSHGGIGIGEYYVYQQEVTNDSDSETFFYKLNLNPSSSIGPDGKIYRNSEFFYLGLYRQGPRSSEIEQVHNCFYVTNAQGEQVTQDYINLMDVNSTNLSVKNEVYYTLQTQGNYIIASQGLPPAASANPSNKYVLPYDTVEGDQIRLAGVYHVIMGDTAPYWEMIIDEDYLFLEDTDQIGDATNTYEALNVGSVFQGDSGDSGSINWYEPQTSSETPINFLISQQSIDGVLAYMQNKLLTIFLTVSYDSLGNEHIKSQVTYRNK